MRNLLPSLALASRVVLAGGLAGLAAGVAATVLGLVSAGRELTPEDFRWSFIIVGLFPVLSVIGFARLKPTDGAEMAGMGRKRR